MIFDHRTYVCRPGKVKAHIALYEKMGLKPQTRILGNLVFYATTEVGDVNSYVHIWGYKDMADRTARRAALWQDPEWLAYAAESGKLDALVSQENKILIAAPFMPPAGR